MQETTIYQVDAFTDRLFGGNPAAVCPLESWLPEETMQAIAAENNLSETAFFVLGATRNELRWFTPTLEIDLCGHATLAAAHVVFQFLQPELSEVFFGLDANFAMKNDKVDTLYARLTIGKAGWSEAEGISGDASITQTGECNIKVGKESTVTLKGGSAKAKVSKSALDLIEGKLSFGATFPVKGQTLGQRQTPDNIGCEVLHQFACLLPVFAIGKDRSQSGSYAEHFPQ